MVHGCHWDPMGSSGNPGGPQEDPTGTRRDPMEIPGDPMGIPGDPMEIPWLMEDSKGLHEYIPGSVREQRRVRLVNARADELE